MTTELMFILVTILLYSITLALNIFRKNDKYSQFNLIAGFIVHLFLLIYRFLITNHPPFTSLYETLLLIPFLLSFRLAFWKKYFSKKVQYWILSFIVLQLLITVLLPVEMKTPKDLMPALNSIWMFIHVPAYLFGYMSIIIALIYSSNILKNNKSAKNLESKLNNEVKISFFFLNLGMITGAIWAFQSWGDYWSWDPKETWALINILILSMYFTTKNIRNKAIIVIISFLTIIFTYLGVNFILPSIHNYL